MQSPNRDRTAPGTRVATDPLDADPALNHRRDAHGVATEAANTRVPTIMGIILGIASLLVAVSSCSAVPEASGSLVVEQSEGVTYIRDAGSPDIDDVRYQGVFVLGDEGCLYVEVDGNDGRQRAVVPRDVEVESDSVKTPNGEAYRFGELVNFSRAYGKYFDDGVSGNDPCDASLELFGVSLPR